MECAAQTSFPLPEAAGLAVREAFAPPGELADAEAFTRRLARSHYENFSVISRLLPKHLRQDFCNIYAFCRLADDLADAIPDRRLSQHALRRFADATAACFRGESVSAVFVALAQTVRKHDIPQQPFLDLIDAFAQDQRITRYSTFTELLDYCRRSANPVGRIVLYLCGYRDSERQRLADSTCTALQLANFWQDVRRDLFELDRIYLPLESRQRFGVTEEQLREGRVDANFRELIRFEVERAETMFQQGQKLLPLLSAAVRPQIALFGAGGRAILQAIRDQNYDTLTRRPTLSRLQKSRLIARVLLGTAGQLMTRKDGGSRS